MLGCKFSDALVKCLPNILLIKDLLRLCSLPCSLSGDAHSQLSSLIFNKGLNEILGNLDEPEMDVEWTFGLH